MQATVNPIIETYSRLAKTYDDDLNQKSCWGRAAEKALASLIIKDDYQLVLDVGCGTGRVLWHLACNSRPGIQFIGIDPATNMRSLATERTRRNRNIEILDGSFEKIPLESWSVDYMYSIFAFHWTTDLEASVKEIARVLKSTAEMDLFFHRTKQRTRIYSTNLPNLLEVHGPRPFPGLDSNAEAAEEGGSLPTFAATLSQERLSVEESYETYYDSLEGHWAGGCALRDSL